MAKSYEYLTVDVFTDRPFAGNPLAVFPDARRMTKKQMQQLAREFNYSESTFVLPPRNRRHTARVRIFNPNDELPFAGHPNVGTAYALALLAQRRRKKLAQTASKRFALSSMPINWSITPTQRLNCAMP